MAHVRFALYVSAVKGHLVTRFGTDRRGVQSYIGAHRVPGEPSDLAWDEGLIVALSEQEVARYSREYARALDGGALQRRTAKEYQAQVAARSKADEEAVAKARQVDAETAAKEKKDKEP